MPSLATLAQGRYAILKADLDDGPAVLGVLLEDPATDQVYIRLRRDWSAIVPDDEVLPLLEDDLASKASEWGAKAFFEWAEEHLSANIRTTGRESVAVEDFDRALNRLYAKHVRSRVLQSTHVPFYSLRAAAGKFIDNDEVEIRDWVEAPSDLRRVTPDLFAAQIVGDSMDPHIPNGSVCLFRAFGAGSRNGRRVLVEERGRTGDNAYTVKVYRSQKTAAGGEWRHESISLEPLNPEHEGWQLRADEDRYRVVAEFVQVLY